MASANDLILAAFRRARIIGKDQVLTDDEAADALAELNRMLDEWWNERLQVFRIAQENFSLVAGQASRTIGSGGNFGTTRPLKIVDGCFVRRNGVDSPVAVLTDREQYDRIPVKTTQGLVDRLFYDPTMSTGTIYFYPVPDQADTIYLNTLARLQSVSALTTTITLPPGYESLIVNGLAIREAPEYGMSAPKDVRDAFAQSRRTLKRLNAPGAVMGFDAGLLPRSGYYDIRTG